MAYQQNTPNQGMDPKTQDAIATQALLTQQSLTELALETQNLSPGQTKLVKLDNSGLVVGLQILVSITGTCALGKNVIINPSPMAPFKLVKNIQVVPDGSSDSRVNSRPEDIYAFNCLNAGKRLGNVGQWGSIGNTGTSWSDSFLGVSPSVLPIGTHDITNGHFSAAFVLDVPTCLWKQGDLRGILNLQNVNSTASLTITTPQITEMFGFGTVDDALNVFSTTATSITDLAPVITSYTCEVVQQSYRAVSYPLPGVPDFVTIPRLSASTAYFISGETSSTDNMTNNAQKKVTLPNNRVIRNALLTYFNNGIAGGNLLPLTSTNPTSKTGTVTRVKFEQGSGNFIFNKTLETYLAMQEDRYGVDIGRGFIAFDFRRNPVSTGVYGALQATLEMPASTTNPLLNVAYEGHYPLGTTLGAITN